MGVFRPTIEPLEVRTLLSSFPFTISGDRFFKDGQPAFLVGIGYSPLKPGQIGTAAIDEARIQDDLRRFQAYQGGSDPVIVRAYPNPTALLPIRMPKGFYDGMRELGFWVLRDISFGGPDFDYRAPDAVANAGDTVDAVINEVAAAGGLDRIFAWQLSDEFLSYSRADSIALETFLCAVRDRIKMRMTEPGREMFSNWVSWGSLAENDPLRTETNNPVLPPCLDFVSYNTYSYGPEHLRDQQAGPGTGTAFAGYLAALKERHPNQPLLISETGLSDSPSVSTRDPDQAKLPAGYPHYRKGGLTGEQIAEGIRDRYWDARLSGAAAGVMIFEWTDEWWKLTEPLVQNDFPEEYFGLVRFDSNGVARHKIQQEAARDLLALNFSSPKPILLGVTADTNSLPATGTTMLHAVVAPDALGPIRYRWETSRGYITGDSESVQFYAGDRWLGDATVTVVAIDAAGRANMKTLSIAIQPSGPPSIELLTLGPGPEAAVAGARASGRVANADLAQYKLAVYIQITGDKQYIQPHPPEMTSIWIRPDGYWWTPVANQNNGQLTAYLIPRSVDPPHTLPSGTRPPQALLLATPPLSINDSLNRQLPDASFPDLSQGRYDDPDQDGATNLEEFLAGTLPTVKDNDRDSDGLWDNWERRYFGRLAFGAADDPDHDGLTNKQEMDLEIHPGRTAVDRDRDGLPDTWELREFGTLAQGADDDANGDGFRNLDAYERGVSAAAIFVTGADAGGGPDVKVYAATDVNVFPPGEQRLKLGFFAFDANFTGGVRVAAGDVNADGFQDVICAAGPGGGPNITVFSGKDGARLMSFFAYDPAFTGGVRVAAGDVNGDGKADVICGAGPGGGPNITVFSGTDGSRLASFFAFDPGFTAGIYVAAGDVNGDAQADIIAGPDAGGGPNVAVFDVSGAGVRPLLNFFAYNSAFTGGVRVAAVDRNGDGKADIIAAPGPGGGPDVSTFSGLDGRRIDQFFSYDPRFTGGLYIAGGGR